MAWKVQERCGKTAVPANNMCSRSCTTSAHLCHVCLVLGHQRLGPPRPLRPLAALRPRLLLPTARRRKRRLRLLRLRRSALALFLPCRRLPLRRRQPRRQLAGGGAGLRSSGRLRRQLVPQRGQVVGGQLGGDPGLVALGL